MTPDVARRLAVIQREWQRIDPKFLDDDEQRFWATIAGRNIRFDQRADFARKFTEGRASKGALETFLAVCAAENPNRRLRMTALADRVSTPVERADFDDLVTLVSQAPPWEKDRSAGVRILLRAIGEGKANAPDQILARWTWRLARATRKVQDRARERGVPGGEAAARRGRQLARSPARGERRQARAGRAGAAARRRRRAARVRRGLHAAREHAARPGPRGARRDPRDRERAGGEPARHRRRRPGSHAGGARSGAARRRARRRPQRRRGRLAENGESARPPESGRRGSRPRTRPERRDEARRPRGCLASASHRRLSPSCCLRGRGGNRVSSAASDSPVGRSASSIELARACRPAARAPRRTRPSRGRWRPPR